MKRIDKPLSVQAYPLKRKLGAVEVQAFSLKRIEFSLKVQAYPLKGKLDTVKLQAFSLKRIECALKDFPGMSTQADGAKVFLKKNMLENLLCWKVANSFVTNK